MSFGPRCFRLHHMLACALATVLASGPAHSQAWESEDGALGRSAWRLALHIGGNYGTMSGSEVERTDAAPGFEGGASLRVFRNLWVFGSYAVSKSNVDGGVSQLLDQRVKEDGRSGHVVGEIESSRIRVGARIDAFREEDWRYQPYLIGAVVFSSNDVRIDSIDGNPNPDPVTGPPPDFQLVDVSNFDDSQLGGMGRFGVEIGISQLFAADVNVTYEVIEFPTGTNALTTLSGGVVLRL